MKILTLLTNARAPRSQRGDQPALASDCQPTAHPSFVTAMVLEQSVRRRERRPGTIQRISLLSRQDARPGYGFAAG
jgi:hypothetical protein